MGTPVCKCTMKEKMRKLFTDHAFYTKFYIESALSDLPDVKVITNRLLQNQVDIGNFVKPVVGNVNGDHLASLLKEHILAAAGAVSAVKKEDEKEVKTAVDKVFANSWLVSQLLSSFNPEKLPFDVVLKIFNQHNQYVIDITTLHFNEDFEKEINTVDLYYQHMLMLSDTLHDALNPALNYPNATRAERHLRYPEGIIIQTSDGKEIPISRQAGRISGLIARTVLRNPDANENVTGWSEEKLNSEPLLEIEFVSRSDTDPTQVVVNYMNHFYGDDSKFNPSGDWERKFAENIFALGTKFVDEVIETAQYFGIPSLIKLLTGE